MDPKHADIPIIDIDRERLRRAKLMSFEQKFMAGAELFDYAVAVAMGGVRIKHPDYDDRQAMAEVRRRMDLARRYREQS